MSSTEVAVPERVFVFLWGFDVYICGFVFVGSGPGLSVSPAMAIG